MKENEQSAGSANQNGANMPTPSALYQRAHANVRQSRGHASEHYCQGFLEPCGKQAKEWAFIERSGESFTCTWIEKKDGRSKEYTRRTSMNPMDFEPMCQRHHKLMDQHLAQVLAEVAA